MLLLPSSKNILWNPKRFTGLVAWYDSQDANTVTLVSGNVSQWRDKSILANIVSQATASKQPSYGTTTLNGKPLIKFDAVDDNLVGADTGLPSGAAVRTAFVVQRFHALTVAYGAWSYGTSGGNNMTFGLVKSNDHFVTVQLWGVNDSVTTSPVVAGTAYQHTAVYNGTNLIQRVNGVQVESVARTPGTVLANFRIGSEQNTLAFVAVETAEIVIYNRTLSTGEILKVETYLRSKWGL